MMERRREEYSKVLGKVSGGAQRGELAQATLQGEQGSSCSNWSSL